MTFFERLSLLKGINIKKLSFFNINTLKIDILANSRIYCILKQLKFNINKKDILMRIKITSFNKQFNENEGIFKHFQEGQDEELRCTIQNSVFYDKNRIPLIIDDVYCEQYEDYYIKNFGVFICNDEGQTVGYGQIILNRGLYTIVNLGILHDYRNQGYGELLVKYLIELCNKNSIKTIYIRVEKNNTKALSLYNKLGFKEYKSIVTWYKNIDLF